MGTEATQRWAANREAKTGERVILTCDECGGKFRPAGGPCIHEHPKILRDNSHHAYCGACGVSWRPGHTCILQPTESDVQKLAMLCDAWLLLDDTLRQFEAALSVATPESWEAV